MSDEKQSGTPDPNAAKQASGAQADHEDVHSRVTVPAPAPERLDPTPRSLRLEPPVIDRVLPPAPEAEITAAEAAVEELPADALIESEIETWRPPPAPPPLPAKSQPVPAGTVAASSSIAPRDLPQREEPQPAKIAGLASIALLGLLGAVAIWFVSGGQPQGERSTAFAPQTPSIAEPAPAPPAAPAPQPIVAPPPPPPAPPPSESAQPQVADSTPAKLAKVPITPEPVPAEIAPAPAKKAKPARRAVEPEPAAPAALPDQPSRQAIADALDQMRSELALCAEGRTGVAELDLTLSAAGTVSHAVVGGDFAGSPQGSCIARSLRRARFAPFQQPKFRVLYRMKL